MSYYKGSLARVERLVELPPDAADYVFVVKLKHEIVANGTEIAFLETVLGGGQPHTQGKKGPVKRLGSPFRGVSFHSCTQRWRSRIKSGSKSQHLGYFSSDVEAAKAYNRAARRIHGDGAQLNEGVEQVFDDSPTVVSELVDATKVPYNGTTYYSDKDNAKKPLARTVRKQQQQKILTTVKSEPFPETFSLFPQEEEFFGMDVDDSENRPFNEDPARIDVPNEWEDFFVQFWFDAPPAKQVDPTPCGRALKRMASFPPMETKRIRC